MPSVKQSEIDGVTYDLGGAGGFSDDAKNALIALLENVAYVGTDGQAYLTDLQNKLFDNYWSITNTLSNASNSNAAQTVEKGESYTATISASAGYTLTGATVSVTMNGADVTASVYNNGTIYISEVTGDVVITVVAVAVALVSIDATYTQSGTVYDVDSLDSLKSDIIVNATYNDASTAIIPSTDYTLSGNLTAGTSTITVTYEGETDTFSVLVTNVSYPIESGSHTFTNGYYNGIKVISASNGHVSYHNPNPITVPGSGQGAAYAIFNKVSVNAASADTSNINSPAATLFTIPSGASVVLEVSNIVCVAGGSTSELKLFAIAARSGSTSVVSTGNLDPSAESKTVSKTFTSSSNITCCFMYVATAISDLSFDIKLFVNGDRWL